jgi:hypothetical protein
MLSKTQFKEWFDRYKHAELAAIMLLYWITIQSDF